MRFRAAVAVVLLALTAMQILPVSCREDHAGASGASGDIACRFEPLQVCDNGNFFLGALADLAVIVPGAPVSVPSTEVLRFVLDGAFFEPEGFHPAIEHPPQLSA